MTLSPARVVEVRPVGRDHEWRRLDDFRRGLAQGARALILRGEAGIGKTVLWRAALGRHRSDGHRVLVTRPAEDELHGAMTGLIDLFDNLEPEAERAVLAPDTDPFDRGRAVLRTLRRLAREGPVVVAIDDVQWLDAISSRALRYALRRLEPEPVGLLATERADHTEHTQSAEPAAGVALHGWRQLDRLEQLDLGPLSIDALRQLLGTVVAIPRPVLERIDQLSGGNPMYAVELARAITTLGDPLAQPVPANLRHALLTRVAGLAPEVQGVLAVAAALGPTPAGALLASCHPPADTAHISDAVAHGVLTVDEALVVRFTHPLLASSVLGGLDPFARRRLHERLAGAATDPDARARHLALSCSHPDATVAAELEAAAGRAGRRGAPALAAAFVSHALRVTPPDDGAATERRAVAEVAHRAAAGDTAHALALADGLLAQLGPGRRRIEVVAQRAYLDTARSEEVLRRALAEVGDDERLAGRVLDHHAWIAGISRGRLEEGTALGERALDIARRFGMTDLEMLAAGTVATTSLLAGRPRPGLLDEAVAIAQRQGGPRLGRWPQVLQGRHHLWGGQLGEARRRFGEMQAVFARSGSEFQRPYRLYDLALLEIAAGNLAPAAELVEDGLEAAHDAGNAQAQALLAYPEGLVHAHLGTDGRAERAADRLAAWGHDGDEPPSVVLAHHVRGVLALAAGDAGAAWVELQAGAELSARLGYRHPGAVPVLPDAIEAAALAGAAGSAADLAAEVSAQAAALALPWVDTAARRGRALAGQALTGQEADADTDPAGALGAAAEAFDALGYRLDGARTLLARGRALRRAGRRTAAAEVLALARDRAELMGARTWQARAAEELERVAPGRSEGTLTATEARIAALVAGGRRNREIAAELFVSVATIEAHLTRMYRKLGVRSRTELAKAIGPPPDDD